MSNTFSTQLTQQRITDAGGREFRFRGDLYSQESTDPRESEIRTPRQLNISLKLSCYLLIIAKLGQGRLPEVCLHWKKSPVYGVFGQ